MDQNDIVGTKRVRKLQIKWTKSQTEKLIQKVEQREELWNPTLKDYKDRFLRREMWEDIAKEMDLSRNEVTTKWNCVRNTYRMFCYKMAATKNTDATEDQHVTNDLYNMLKFLDPALRSEPRHNRNNTVSNISENSLNIEEESSDDHKESFDLSSPAHTINKRPRFDEQEENYDNFLAVNAAAPYDMPVGSDIWDKVGQFVALNGREWAKENYKLASQFKTAIYKMLADFQEKAEEPAQIL